MRCGWVFEEVEEFEEEEEEEEAFETEEEAETEEEEEEETAVRMVSGAKSSVVMLVPLCL